MTNLASNVAWGTAPINRFDFAYEHERVQSTMRYRLKIDCAPCYGASYYGYPIYLEISLDGKVLDTHTLKDASPYRWTEPISYTTDWLAVSGKVTGTTALTIRIYSSAAAARNVRYSYSLPVIPTVSDVSATDANIGRACSIIISRASQSLRHTLSYKFYGQDAFTTIITKTEQAIVPWTVPKSAYSLIPNMPNISCTIKCDTYSGDSLMGSSECEMIASASESECAPTVTATASDINPKTLSVTGNASVVVKGYSNLAVKVTATAKNSASIDKITVTCGGKSSDVADGSATIEGADSAAVTVTVRDSRGFSRSYTVPGLSLVNYTPCWITPEITRPTPTGDSITLSVTGRCYIGAIGQSTNVIALRWRSKAKGGEWGEWLTAEASVTDGTISAEASYSGFEYSTDYTVEVEVADLITSSTKTVPIMRGVPIYWWGEDHFTFNVPIRGAADADGLCPLIEGGLVIRGGDLMLLGSIVATSGAKGHDFSTSGNIKLSGAEIYLNGTKLSDILSKIGLAQCEEGVNL